MIRDAAAVRRSLERWEAGGLLDSPTAERLRVELETHSEQAQQRFVRLLLASTAALVLVIAAATFTAWMWPTLEVAARCFFLGGLGLLLAVVGAWLEPGPRREPAWLLQAAGLVLIAIALAYSAERWPGGSTGGVIAGVIALLTPVVGLAYYARRSDVMPVIVLLLGYFFLAIFAVRALALEDELFWLLDGAFLLESLLLILALRSTSPPAWVTGAAAALLYVLPLLIVFTMAGPLDADGSVEAWPLDAWLVGATALILWLQGRARGRIRPELLSAGLAVSVLLGIGFAFHTMLNALDAPPEAAALAVAAVGSLALLFAVPRGERQVLVAGAVALVVAAWYYAMERGEALSAFLALGFSAGILFWVSTRVGARISRA